MPLERSELLAAPVHGAVEGVLGDVLHRAAREGPDDVLLCTPATGETWTAAQLLSDAQGVAAGLLERWAPGARIATCLGNGPEPVLLQLGVALAGMTLVPINPRSRPAELEHALGLSGAVCLYAAVDVGGNPVADLAAQAAGRLPALQEIRRCGDDWRAAIELASPSDAAGRGAGVPRADPVHVGHHRPRQGRADHARRDGGHRPGLRRPAGADGGAGLDEPHAAVPHRGQRARRGRCALGPCRARRRLVRPGTGAAGHGRAPGHDAVGRADAAGPAWLVSRPAGHRPVGTAGAVHRRHDRHPGASSTGWSRCSGRGCPSRSA